MRNSLIVLIILILIGCAINIDPTPDENHVIIHFDHISQVYQLCLDVNPDDGSLGEIEYKQLIAQCTLDEIDLLDSKITLDDINFCAEPLNEEEINICEQLELLNEENN